MFNKLIVSLFIFISCVGSANAWNIPGSRYDDNYRNTKIIELARASKAYTVYWDVSCAGLYGYVGTLISTSLGTNHIFDYSYYNQRSYTSYGYNSPINIQQVYDGFLFVDSSYCTSPSRSSYYKAPSP